MVGHDGRPQPHRGNHDHRVDNVGRLGPTTCNAGCPRRPLASRYHVAAGEYLTQRRLTSETAPDLRQHHVGHDRINLGGEALPVHRQELSAPTLGSD